MDQSAGGIQESELPGAGDHWITPSALGQVGSLTPVLAGLGSGEPRWATRSLPAPWLTQLPQHLGLSTSKQL